MSLPPKGLPEDEIFSKLESFRNGDLDWRSGRVFGYVFDPGKAAMGVGKKAYTLFLTENGLDFTAFPSLLRLENELVGMAVAHLRGDKEVVGNFTSGGTESIILAVKTARDLAREKHPDIREPEMILPSTGHAAFHKAAHYLDVRVVQVPVDPETFRADPEVVGKAVTPETILLVGSAPSYAHGVVDPIRELGKIALEKDLPLHVDACMGGFMLPYLKRLGEPIPDFDFSVPGVTSISMDLHKYAYTPKGASLILYKNKAIRKHQIYACARWTGYTVVNNAVQSSKSGGPMAAAWAVLNYIGDEGYLEIARRKLEATKKIIRGIEENPDLRLMTRPDMCLVAFTSDTVHVFQIIDEMNGRGWYVQPALTYEGSRENIHLSINASNVEWVDRFLKDLADSVKKMKGRPPGKMAGLLKQNLDALEPGEMDDGAIAGLLDMAGIRDGGLPEQMAEINEVLNILPAGFREKLLVAFANNLFVPK
jgi:glutamate/tyrosine decarboxylase-like PLP-dependent enzyme